MYHSSLLGLCLRYEENEMLRMVLKCNAEILITDLG
jgi:hypothetical protein